MYSSTLNQRVEAEFFRTDKNTVLIMGLYSRGRCSPIPWQNYSVGVGLNFRGE
jgi:hypothetical protein